MQKGNDALPDKEALMRFAASDTGRALLARLDRSDPSKIRAVIEKASSGDIEGAMKVLKATLSAVDGTKEGENGKRS